MMLDDEAAAAATSTPGMRDGQVRATGR